MQDGAETLKIGKKFVVTLALAALSLPLACAQAINGSRSSAFPDTVQLPQTSNIGAFASSNSDFYVAQATAKNLNGVPTHGVPAWTITIRNGVGGWDGPTNLRPPQAALDAPGERKIALFQVESGLGGGWIVVPLGWRVVSAASGAQGSWHVTFVAQSGPRAGWVTVGGSGPGKTEVFSAAEGYFPGAYHLENEVIPGTLSQDAVLSPIPQSLRHPDPCTALVFYESEGLAVNGVQQFGKDGVTGMFVALPDREAKLRRFLFTTFRAQHPVSTCPRDVKDW